MGHEVSRRALSMSSIAAQNAGDFRILLVLDSKCAMCVNTMNMNFSLSRMMRVVLPLVAASSVVVVAQAEEWVTDFAAAKKQAEAEKKDLFLDFTGSDWCGWCIRLHKEVFDQAVFKEGARGNFVLVELDFPQQKELPAALKQQNDELAKKFQVEGYPTVFLCDAQGRPYAKTGYMEGGAEAYLAELNKMREVRVKRDAAFAAAEAASEPLAKAEKWIEGLKLIDTELLQPHYEAILSEIAKLDPEDRSGFIAQRKKAEEEKKNAAKAEEAIESFLSEKIEPLMEKKDFAAAKTELQAFFAANPTLPEEHVVGLTMHIGLAEMFEKKDVEGAVALVNQVSEKYPQSELAQHKDDVIASVKEEIEAAKTESTGEVDPNHAKPAEKSDEKPEAKPEEKQ